MMVVDANIIIYLFRESSFTSLARQAYALDRDWIVPELWEAEVLNGLMREVRAGFLSLNEAITAASNATAVLARKVHPCDPAEVLKTAAADHLTAYDAYYVTLARTMDVRLLTEDGLIKSNCRDVALSLKAFLGLDEGKTPVVREKQGDYRVVRKTKKQL